MNAELTRELASNSSGAAVTSAHVTIDTSGFHFTGDVTTPLGPWTANGDASVGPLNGRLGLHVRSLSAGPIPGPMLDSVRSAIEKNATDVSDQIPFTVRQVALRSGCFAIMGTSR